ncbi:MAG: hypothetical protein HN366_20135 [Deltaproteobacteria bacterium]|nr:hypothetical protein [Deltaproteobacteria bacterium]
MEKKKIEEKKKKVQEPLAPCTAAPAAEHARAHDEDEPCDDGRAGVTGKA